MKKIEVKTGFGYLKDAQGHITDRARLPAGEHPIKDGYTYFEVNNQTEFDAIETYQDPAQVQAVEQQRKIDVKLREIAIIELTKEGNWP